MPGRTRQRCRLLPEAGARTVRACLKLETKLSEVEAQRDELLERLDRAWDENRRLRNRNADLRERLVRL